MKIKLTTISILASIIAMVITGCSSDHIESEETISGRLVIWEHSASFEEPLIRVIDGFQRKYPDVIVEYEIKSGNNYYDMLNVAIQAGDAPDIFWTNGTATSDMYDLVNLGVLYDLTEHIDTSAILPEMLSISMVNDRLYAIPWMTFDTRACFYNKDHFEKMGLEVPQTFNDFETILAIIKENRKVPISLGGMSSWSILFFFEPLLSAMEPDYSRELSDYQTQVGDPRVGNVLRKALEWADSGYFGDSFLNMSYDAKSRAFIQGDATMVITGSWEVSAFSQSNPNLNFGAFQIPSSSGNRGIVGTYANGFSIFKNTLSPEAAIAFLNYCASLEAQAIWVQTLDAVSASPDIESVNPIVGEITDYDERFISWHSILRKHNNEGNDATDIWNEYSLKVFSRMISIDDFLDKINNATH